MSENCRLTLKGEPDGFGFIYGRAEAADGRVVRVDIMPPEPEWSGDIKMERYGPHPTDWVVYADGEEIARVASRDELQTAALKALDGGDRGGR